MSDGLDSTLSFFGRVVDDFRREPAWLGEYRITLASPPAEALYKQDGHFAFANLPPSAMDYSFRLVDGLYQGRSLQKGLPSTIPVEIAYAGEDEIYLVIKTVNAATKQITFDPIPFLPVIRRGSEVLGEGVFSTTLAEDLAGVDVTTALLTGVVGLSSGNLLRIVRSRCLRAKAGPYYPFPSGTTVFLLKVVEDSPAEPPLAAAKGRLMKVNALTPSTATVGGLPLHYLSLAGPPAQQPVLGTDADRDSFTEKRGNAVFYFPGHWLLSSIEIEVSCPGYVTATSVFAVTAGQTMSAKVKLVVL